MKKNIGKIAIMVVLALAVVAMTGCIKLDATGGGGNTAAGSATVGKMTAPVPSGWMQYEDSDRLSIAQTETLDNVDTAPEVSFRVIPDSDINGFIEGQRSMYTDPTDVSIPAGSNTFTGYKGSMGGQNVYNLIATVNGAQVQALIFYIDANDRDVQTILSGLVVS